MWTSSTFSLPIWKHGQGILKSVIVSEPCKIVANWGQVFYPWIFSLSRISPQSYAVYKPLPDYSMQSGVLFQSDFAFNFYQVLIIICRNELYQPVQSGCIDMLLQLLNLGVGVMSFEKRNLRSKWITTTINENNF